MLLDYINSLLEFIMVLEFFLIFSEEKLQIKSLIIYACCAFLCSLYFVQPFSGILFINAPLFLLSVCISFRDEPFFHSLFAAGTAFLCTIILEFTTLSFIPVSLLQTYLGSLISNLAILIPVMVILLFVRKQHLNSVLSVFVWRFRFILSCVLIIFLFLGQFYLSRLSAVWSHLPGIIAFCVLLVLIFSFSMQSSMDSLA